jgi:spore maturation protein A
MEYKNMLDYMWGIMIVIGVLYGAATGNLEAVTQAVLESAGEAVSICITMIGVMSLWVGLMQIAKEAGLIGKMTEAIRPAIHFMFPRIPAKHPALEYISTNVIANILGLGWAATPAGLKAMEALAELEQKRIGKGTLSTKATAVASDEMCTFLVLNISSLQLIPVTIIAYRSQYGSPDPTAVIAPAILATLVSTLAAIIFCKCMTMRNKQ